MTEEGEKKKEYEIGKSNKKSKIEIVWMCVLSTITQIWRQNKKIRCVLRKFHDSSII